MQLSLFLVATCMFSFMYANEVENDSQWVEYKNKHDKVYENSGEELARFVFFSSKFNHPKIEYYILLIIK
jgi:hypothetical protein